MGDIQYAKSHKITLDNRKNAAIRGVTEVVSFDEDCVVLETEQGILTIKGKDLHVVRLDVDKGELEMAGEVDSMVYTQKHDVRRSASGLVGRLFK